MRRTIVVAVGLVVAGGLTTSLLVSGVTHSSGERGTQPEGVGGVGGVEDSAYPKRLTQGTYESTIWGNSAPIDAVPRANVAAKSEGASPKFRGWVSSVYLRPDSFDRTAEEAVPSGAHDDLGCRFDELDAVGPADFERSAYAIPIPTFLPPGTFEAQPPSGTSCHGSPVMLTRQFIMNSPNIAAHIGIIRLIGVNVYDFSASAGRVTRGSVQGKDAVFISSVTAEGFGGSAIIIKEEYGLTKVGGDDVPFDVLQRVAEAIGP